MKNYPDYFASMGRNLVKKADGTFIVVTNEEMEELIEKGKVKVEIANTKGGKFRDLTQKPIMVLNE